VSVRMEEMLATGQVWLPITMRLQVTVTLFSDKNVCSSTPYPFAHLHDLSSLFGVMRLRDSPRACRFDSLSTSILPVQGYHDNLHKRHRMKSMVYTLRGRRSEQGVGAIYEELGARRTTCEAGA
jgi:hypothetical protein